MKEEINGSIGLAELIQAVMKNRKLLIASVLLFAVIFLLYAILATKQYQSKSIVFTSFNEQIEGPFGKFKLANKEVKYYLRDMELEGVGDHRLEIDYGIDSDDASTITFTVKHEVKDSLVPAFNRVYSQFSNKVEQYIKKEAVRKAISGTKSDLSLEKLKLRSLKNNVFYLKDLKQKAKKSEFNQREMKELKSLGVSFSLDELLGDERRVVDSILVETKVNLALTNSKIDSYEYLLDSLTKTSTVGLTEEFSFSNQVLDVYRPLETPKNPNRADWIKRTALGGFVGLIIGFFIIFFRAVTPKSKG